MAKHTTRDRVWSAALHLRETQTYFTVEDVVEAAELDGEVSERTVRDCLNTMGEMGHLSGNGAGRQRRVWSHPVR